MTSIIKAKLSFDGGCRPTNPGHAGFAAVVTIYGEEFVIARPIKGRHTNNYAEYMGLVVGIKYAKHLGATHLDVTGDSKLVVEQTKGNWRAITPENRPLQREARAQLDKLFAGAWTLTWVPRAENSTADAACAQAVLCSMNPWKLNKQDPFRPNSSLVKLSRVRARSRALAPAREE